MQCRSFLILFLFGRDELLPLVHLSWRSLKLLFASENLFIVDKAFDVLQTLAMCAGDFIRKRTVKDVFPAVMSYITRLQIITKDSRKEHTLAARQARKLLANIVHGLWNFMKLLDLNELEVDAILEQLIEFIEVSDKSLSEDGRHCYIMPSRRQDCDALWLKTKARSVRIKEL